MDTLNKPLDFSSECWDLFAQSHDEHQADWENEDACTPTANVDPSTTNAFEVKS